MERIEEAGYRVVNNESFKRYNEMRRGRSSRLCQVVYVMTLASLIVSALIVIGSLGLGRVLPMGIPLSATMLASGLIAGPSLCLFAFVATRMRKSRSHFS